MAGGSPSAANSPTRSAAACSASIADLGIASVKDVRAVSVYLITGALSAAQLQRIASRLLCDPVNEEFSFRGPVRLAAQRAVRRRPGLPQARRHGPGRGEHEEGHRRHAGFSAASVRTGRKFLLYGKPIAATSSA